MRWALGDAVVLLVACRAYTNGPPNRRRDPIAAELRKAIAEMESF